jgi:hypothetical protein
MPPMPNAHALQRAPMAPAPLRRLLKGLLPVLVDGLLHDRFHLCDRAPDLPK